MAAMRLAVALLAAGTLGFMATPASAQPFLADGRFVIRSKAAIRALDGRRILDLDTVVDPPDVALARESFSRAEAPEPDGTVHWNGGVTAFRRAGATRWRLRATSAARPRWRIRLAIDPAAKVKGRLSGRGIGNVSFVATPSTCGDGFLDTGAGEQCETSTDCAGSRCADGCVCSPVNQAFGSDGVAAVPVATPTTVLDLAVRTDGRIVGLSARGDLFQLLADGRLDAGFGANGVVQTGIAGDAGRLALQTNGDVVVAGPRTLRRYGEDGSADPSFGDGGAAHFADDVIVSRFERADGRIPIAIGNSLSRLLADGSTDPQVGVVEMHPSPNVATSYRFTGVGEFDPDGRFVATHDFLLARPTRYDTRHECLTRFLADGAVDPTFAGGVPSDPAHRPNCVTGSSTGPNPSPSSGTSRTFVTPTGATFVTRQVAGYATGYWDMLAFDESGTQVAATFTCTAVCCIESCLAPRTLAAGADGAMAAIADTLGFGFHVIEDLGPRVVRRLHADGTVDMSFGDGGVVVLPDATAVAVQADGMMLVGSARTGDDGATLLVTRLR